MPVTITITLPPESQALIQKFSDAPEEVPKAIKRGMDRATQIIVGRIQQNRLSGQGPFPLSEHRLGERTGQLRGSARAEPAVIAGDTITAEIGTPVIYGAVHEFGATIIPRRGQFLVFKIDDKTIFARKSVIPERAPFRTEIVAQQQVLVDEIMSELQTAVTKP
jgi:phage gpG-like protein